MSRQEQPDRLKPWTWSAPGFEAWSLCWGTTTGKRCCRGWGAKPGAVCADRDA